MKIKKRKICIIETLAMLLILLTLFVVVLPFINDVAKYKKVMNMVKDEEILKKSLILYNQKTNKTGLLNENEKLITKNNNPINKLSKKDDGNDVDTICTSLQETLKNYNDSEEYLYRININEIDDFLVDNILLGHKKHSTDFYVYSTKTGNVYYYAALVNADENIYHNAFNTLTKKADLVKKKSSPNLNGEEIIINNDAILKLTTNLENVTTDSLIDWTYDFNYDDKKTLQLSFVLNGTEYNNIDKVPQKLDAGNYIIKFKVQNNYGIWSNEITKEFTVKKVKN